MQTTEAPIISQVWDLLEEHDDQRSQQPDRLGRSTSAPADGVTSSEDMNGGGKRLSLKKLFKPRSSKASSRQNTEQAASSTSEDDSPLLSSHVVSGIPSTEIELANYIVAHGILKKQLRSLSSLLVKKCFILRLKSLVSTGNDCHTSVIRTIIRPIMRYLIVKRCE